MRNTHTPFYELFQENLTNTQNWLNQQTEYLDSKENDGYINSYSMLKDVKPQSGPILQKRSEESFRMPSLCDFPDNEEQDTSLRDTSTTQLGSHLNQKTLFSNTSTSYFQQDKPIYLSNSVFNEYQQFNSSQLDQPFISLHNVKTLTDSSSNQTYESSSQNSTENFIEGESTGQQTAQNNNSNLINPKSSSQQTKNDMEIEKLSSVKDERRQSKCIKGQQKDAKKKNKESKDYPKQLLTVLKNNMVQIIQGEKELMEMNGQEQNAYLEEYEDIKTSFKNNKTNYQERLIKLLLEGKKNNFPGLLKDLYSNISITNQQKFTKAYIEALKKRRKNADRVKDEEEKIKYAVHCLQKKLKAQLQNN